MISFENNSISQAVEMNLKKKLNKSILNYGKNKCFSTLYQIKI